ncbi:MAG: ComF family protein [Inhella sp.]|jgi:ComF family protein|nr:ComF family protein [Inhella sp.]
MDAAWLNPTRWRLPGGCWICREWGSERLCAPCVAHFAAARARCPTCAMPQPGPHCAACLREPLPLDAVQAAVDFEPPWDDLLHQLKYGAALGLAPALGALMAARMALPEDALLLPVPLHPRRLGERGYNQAALLAAELARALRRPWRPDLLRRVIDTPAQARLTRAERLRNLRHAFAPASGFEAAGGSFVLVDDVMTTGATLATLAGLLRAAGAARVEACVVARTPEPER